MSIPSGTAVRGDGLHAGRCLDALPCNGRLGCCVSTPGGAWCQVKSMRRLQRLEGRGRTPWLWGRSQWWWTTTGEGQSCRPQKCCRYRCTTFFARQSSGYEATHDCVDHHAQAICLAVWMHERRYTRARAAARYLAPRPCGDGCVFRVNDDICRNTLRPTITQVHPCAHGVELRRLLGVEWTCHGLFEEPSTMLLNGFIHGVGGEVELARPFDEPLVAMDVLE